jgi:hypothetical protein
VIHERLTSNPPLPLSERTYGLVLAGVLIVLACLPALFGRPARWWLLIAAGLPLTLSLVAPRLLVPLRTFSMRAAHVVGTVLTHAAAAFLLYAVFAPIGRISRRRRPGPLRLDWEPGARSYWIPREPGASSPESMINQF